jgi:hypothetical protein
VLFPAGVPEAPLFCLAIEKSQFIRVRAGPSALGKSINVNL